MTQHEEIIALTDAYLILMKACEDLSDGPVAVWSKAFNAMKHIDKHITDLMAAPPEVPEAEWELHIPPDRPEPPYDPYHEHGVRRSDF